MTGNTVPTTLEDKSVTPTKYISIHGDLDGFVSGLMYQLSHPEEKLEVHIADQFGECNGNIKVMVDQRPIDPTWKGLCIDHHEGHPDENGREYELVWDKNKTTTLIVYELYKDKIPKEEIWKVAIGMYGDGSDAETPTEVWLSCPDLLNTSGYPKDSYGQTKIFPVAVYKMCGSLINFAGRMGSSNEAFHLLSEATTPWDIISNKYLRAARKSVTDEVGRVIKTATFPIDLGRKVYWEYETDRRIWIAQTAYDTTGKTSIAVNRTNRKVSIRGPIALYIAEELTKKGIEAGGHPGFCGAHLTEEQMDKLLTYLKEMAL